MSSTLYGTSGNNTLTGDAGANLISGGTAEDPAADTGRDRLSGLAGQDTIYGHGGADTLLGGEDDDALYGGTGNDRLESGGAGGELQGEAGADTLIGSSDNTATYEYLRGGTEGDRILSGGGYDVVTGEDGADTIIAAGMAPYQHLDGGLGADLVDARLAEAGGSVYLHDNQTGAEDAADTLLGGAGNDSIYSNGGADSIDGGGEEDYLYLDRSASTASLSFVAASSGAATVIGDGTRIANIGRFDVRGGTGNDRISLLDGADVALGNEGADTLSGGAGYDVLYGGAGDDRLEAGADGGYLYGDAGADTLVGSSENSGVWDYLYGGTGDDRIETGGGADQVAGEEGADTIVASGGNAYQSLDGGAGADLVDARLVAPGGTVHLYDGGTAAEDGADTLLGSAGNDSIYSNAGADSIDGGAEADLLYFDRHAATLSLTLVADAAGAATVIGDGTRVVNVERFDVRAGSGNDLFSLLAGDDVAFGNDGADTLRGGGGYDVLRGEAGDDRIEGGTGAGVLNGEDGADTLLGSSDNAGDWEYFHGGTGNDLIRTGGGQDQAQADDGADTIIASGGAAYQHLDGGAGADLLDARLVEAGGTVLIYDHLNGAEGAADTLLGSLGADAIYADGGGDSIDGGAGLDFLSFDRTGAAGALRLVLPASGVATVTGDGTRVVNVEQFLINGGLGNDLFSLRDGDDTIFGHAGADTLRGGAGHDQLFGGDGNDQLESGVDFGPLHGEAGDDTLLGSNDSTGAYEYFYGGVGNDSIQTGGGYAQALGEDGADTIIASGSALAEFLDGGAQADRIDARLTNAGGAVYLLDNASGAEDAADTMLGGAGNDSIYSYGGADSIDGGAGDDLLTLTRGADDPTPLLFSMAGGLASFGDVRVANVETFAVTGGAGNDSIAGGAYDDTLFGGAGDDTLAGGGGTINYLYAGTGNDRFILEADNSYIDDEGGIDEAWVPFAFTMPSWLEHARLTGSANVGVAGNELDNSILGNGGANSLSGAAGADTLVGDAGGDTLDGGDGSDVLLGGSGNDRFDGGTGVDLAILEGSFGEYVITFASNRYTLVRGAERDTVVSNVERVQFGAGGPVADLRAAPTGGGFSTILTAEGPSGVLVEAGTDEDGTPATLQVAENSPAGTLLALVTAGDANLPAGDVLSFALVDGAGAPLAAAPFAITKTGATTAEIRVAGLLDFEAAASHALNIRITDLAGNATTLVRSLTLLDVNEAPFATTTSLSAPENQQAVGTVAATDPDAVDSIHFSLMAGAADNALFQINATSGALSFAASGGADFEAAASYTVRVRVADAGDAALATISDIAIAVQDVNEAPQLLTTSLLVDENTQAVGTVQGSDPDAAPSMRFSLVGGAADNALFTLDTNTGALSFSAAAGANFEIDAAYTVRVRVEDVANPALGNEGDIAVTVTDVNEAPILNSASLTVAENLQALGTLSASDPDLVDSIRFSLVAGALDNALFQIGSLSGALAFVSAAGGDFETQSLFQLRVRVADATDPALATLRDITVTLTDVLEGAIPTEGADLLAGGVGAETILALGGNDTLLASTGADLLDGGAGSDTLRFTTAVRLDLRTPANSTGEAAGDVHRNIERFEGSNAADTLLGGTGAEIMDGRGGNDRISAIGGADTLLGGNGADSLLGSNDANLLNGGTGNDTLNGGRGSDTMIGGLGRDNLTLAADAARDVLLFRSAIEGSDAVSGFVAGEDQVHISRAGFGLEEDYVLDAATLLIGAAPLAVGEEPLFLFNTTSRVLSFDANGAAGGGVYSLATFSSGLPAAGDFLLVA